jgi:Fic family protein
MITLAKPIEADALRIRHEFLEMSGLRLTVAQTARLVGVSLAHATMMLDALVEEEFLMRTTDGAYGRARPLLA